MIDLNWYYTLHQPPLTPFADIFPPVWAFLYVLIFISLVLFAVKRTDEPKAFGYILFTAQIVINLSWSPVFFVFHNISAALILIILLDLLVLFNIKEFYKISQKSAYFLIPYFLWILYATYLTAGFLLLN